MRVVDVAYWGIREIMGFNSLLEMRFSVTSGFHYTVTEFQFSIGDAGGVR